jgi:hypothetical protein
VCAAGCAAGLQDMGPEGCVQLGVQPALAVRRGAADLSILHQLIMHREC